LETDSQTARSVSKGNKSLFGISMSPGLARQLTAMEHTTNGTVVPLPVNGDKPSEVSARLSEATYHHLQRAHKLLADHSTLTGEPSPVDCIPAQTMSVTIQSARRTLAGISRQKSCPGITMERPKMLSVPVQSSDDITQRLKNVSIRKAYSISLKPLKTLSTNHNSRVTDNQTYCSVRQSRGHSRELAARLDDDVKKPDASAAAAPQETGLTTAPRLANNSANTTVVSRPKMTFTGMPKQSVDLKPSVDDCELMMNNEPPWFALARQKTQKTQKWIEDHA
jgi:hypothetical protein